MDTPMSTSAMAGDMQEKMGDSSGKWKLESIDIKPAENGFTVRCGKKKEGKKGSDYRTKEYVFESAEAVVSHVKELLGGGDPKGDYQNEED